MYLGGPKLQPFELAHRLCGLSFVRADIAGFCYGPSF